jgi:hypothetical protein
MIPGSARRGTPVDGLLFVPVAGLSSPRPSRAGTTLPRMENDLVKRVVWSGLLTAVGALASIVTQRTAAYVWRRVFDEEPPE